MEARFCDERGRAGFSWVIEEPMTRTSHALVSEGRVWLVDPVDWSPAIDRVTSAGSPAGVVQLLDRHARDCAALAARLSVEHHVLPDRIPGAPFEVVPVLDRYRWRENALWWESERALVVAEAIGSNPFFTEGGDAVGVHGLLKAFPPRRQLGRFAPEHLLVGHGEGIHGTAATAELRRALARSRLRFVTWGLTLPLRARRDAREPGSDPRGQTPVS